MPWKEKVDPKSGRTYYYNTESRETTWKRPPGFGSPAATPTSTPPANAAPATAPTSTPSADAPGQNVATEASPTLTPAKATTAEPAATASAAAASTPESQPAPMPAPMLAEVSKEELTAAGNAVPAESTAPEEESAAVAEVREGGAACVNEATATQPVADAHDDRDGDGAMTVQAQTAAESPAQPQCPPLDEAAVRSLYDDMAQRVIAAATRPFPYRNALLCVSSEVLLQMVGAPAGAPSSGTPGRVRDVHPSHTLLTMQRRLSEEARSKLQLIRDQYEDALKAANVEHAAEVDALRQAHSDAVERLQAQFSQASVGAQCEKGETATSAGTQGLPAAHELERLQQRLLEDPEAGRRPSATTQRLLTFWRAKHASTCKQLELRREQLLVAKAKLGGLADLTTTTPENLRRIAGALREREQQERQRAAELQRRYRAEAAQRGLSPQEPSLRREVVLTSQLSNATLLSATASLEGALVDSGDRTRNAAARTPQPQGLNASFQSNDASASIEPLSQLTCEVPELSRRFEQLSAAEAQATTLRAAIEDARLRVGKLQDELDEQQTQYCAHVGGLRTSSSQLLEEIVALRGRVEEQEQRRFCHRAAAADAAAASTARVASLTMQLKRALCTTMDSRERYRRSVREADLDLMRVARRVDVGLAVTEADFGKGPLHATTNRLAVLRAHLAVLDAERHALRAEIAEATGASTVLQTRLTAALTIPADEAQRTRK